MNTNAEDLQNLNHLLFGIKTSDAIKLLAQKYCTCFRSRLKTIEIAPANHAVNCRFRNMLQGQALQS